MARARIPAAVWALFALHTALLAVASFVYPLYRAPDESAHIDLVIAVAREGGYPLDRERITEQITESYALIGHDPHDPGQAPPLQAADAPPRATRPSLSAITPDAPSWRPQHMTQHPPLYSLLLGWTLRLTPGAENWPFDRTGAFLRLLNALMVAPLPLIAWAVTRRLRAPAAIGVTAAIVTTGIPQLTHLGSSVNNDNLLALLGALIFLPLTTLAQGDARRHARRDGRDARRDTDRKTALILGLLGGLALLTKGFALSLPLWIGAAALGAVTGARHRRPALRRAVTTAGIALGGAALIGGWWWVRNLVVHRTIQPSGIHVPEPPAGFSPDVGWWLRFFWRRLSQRFWIEPNVLPGGAWPVEELAMIGLGVLLVAALVLSRRHGIRRAVLVALLAPAVGIGLIVVYGAWRYYAASGIPFGIHGRYLYPGVVGLAVVAACGAWALLRERAAPTLLALAVLLQARALWLALDFYWADGWSAVLAWSPWPVGASYGVLAATVAAVAATVVALSRSAGGRGSRAARGRRSSPARARRG